MLSNLAILSLSLLNPQNIGEPAAWGATSEGSQLLHLMQQSNAKKPDC
jgi:hypothetical protein